MKFQFTHPAWLWLLPLAWVWVIWWARKTDVQIGAWRRWTALGLRLVIVLAAVLAMAGLQWLRPVEGVNVFFLLDRSDSIPAAQQESARRFVNQAAADKKKIDRAGVLVFGSEAALEFAANEAIDLQKILAIVPTERTDLAAAIRLGTAAFPETGQKRLVLLSDGNENLGDAMAALLAARPLGVTLDVVPLGAERGGDISVQRLGVPSRVKKGQTFEAKIFVQADQAQSATVRLYRSEQALGEQKVELSPGKNLFTFPQTLNEPGFYSYTVYLDAAGDAVPQNNRATAFVNVRGEPRALILSAAPSQDASLAAALESARLEVKLTDLSGLPKNLAELQSYDTVFLSNLAAGDLGADHMTLLQSAVRDFGVGLVCVGGDQAFTAGSYRGTPLEATLPLNMELDSKKVLPSGAVALVMHGMEFMNGNAVARECALGVLDALGPQDQMGVVLWDGFDRWLFPMTKVGNKKALGAQIAGMNQGDLPSFQNVMSMAHAGLKQAGANLKHMIVFSDGDPAPPAPELMQSIRADKITVSTVLIAGHAGPNTMMWIADQGNGRFYDVKDPTQLPQIFIKETAVILKSAIIEERFKPRLAVASELVQGIGADEYPNLHGYVGTTPKPRAEVPLVSDKGDPVLAHWQYGLGRAAAFTSDASPRWAKDWLQWGKYRQFWAQVTQWSLRRVASADFATEVAIDQGEGHVSVEALDEKGDYRNFLNLQTVIIGPKGERQVLRLEQSGPGRYEARFPAPDVGSYVLNLMEVKEGKLAASQVIGASLNYSPEFAAPGPNLALLRRLAEAGAGRLLDPLNPADNPFQHDRKRTFQPRDLWEWFFKCALILFVLDIAVRRIQLDREELAKAWAAVKRAVIFWRTIPRPAEADQSLTALLARREQVRATTTAPAEARPELFQPAQPAPLPQQPSPVATPSPQVEPEKPPEAPPSVPPPPVTTTSRLLAAKQRARKKMK
jgi:uncharacterized membrane protein